MKTTHILTLAALLLASLGTKAQWTTFNQLGKGVKLELETTTNAGGGDYAPLWLSSNRYGLSSTETCWNYERVALRRDISNDSLRNWRMGYGADVAVMFGGEQTVCLQEAFVEAAWRQLYITAGSKRQPIAFGCNHRLTSGGLGYGINARPIPQIRVGAEYFSIPFTNNWWQWRGHLSFGWKTDGAWQRKHLREHGLLNKPVIAARRTEGTLYHEKALYWKVGNTRYFPLEAEMGLQWAAEFGGTAYSFYGRGITCSSTVNGVKLGSGFDAYKNALLVGGDDVTDGNIKNTEGNHLGSWVVALTWHGKGWTARAYAERFFEDISQLGVTYGISDHLFGLEVCLPRNPYLGTVVLEHLNTREQSGAVYHDYSTNIHDKMNGRDDYYNHNIYTGWQNYGMSMGTPLLTSPLYNAALGQAGRIACLNNRVRAWHVGLAGEPTRELSWRALLTFSRNWGTYLIPLPDPADQTYLMLEATYSPRCLKGWSGSIAVGADHGSLIGNNTGAQLTIIKTLDL